MSGKIQRTITITFNDFDFGHIIKKFIPYSLIGIVLLAINLGLYKYLLPEQQFDTFIYPYEQDFADVEIHRWFVEENNGTWELNQEALSQSMENVIDGQIYIPHWLISKQPYHISVQIDLSTGGQSAGINFNAQYPDINTQHHRAVITRRENEFVLVTGMVTEENGFQKLVQIPIDSLEQPFRMDVLVSEEIYAVQINGQTLIENRPLVYQDGLVGLIATGGPMTFDDLKLTEIEDNFFNINLGEFETLPREIPELTIGDMIYTSNFSGGAQANGWVPFSGDWDIVDGYLTQQDPIGYDFGIGYEQGVFQTFILQVALTLNEGTGAGILFNMPTPDKVNGAHMVRFAESGNGVFWGYYDENGVFTGQGHAIMLTDEGSTHTIKVVGGVEAYEVYVDNQQVAVDVPLIRDSGYIGLTTSRSAVAFGLVDVSNFMDPSTLTNDSGTTNWLAPLWASPSFYGDGFNSDAPNSEWIPITGHWRIKEDTLVQTDKGGYDFSIGYSGEFFQNYRLDVPLTHISGMGGGVLFNMPSPDSLEWASIVRYSDITSKLMWGYFNGAGQFMGQGSVEVPSPGTDAHTISVISRENTYEILLDGQIVGQDVPLARKGGYIGLVTSRSTVRFGPLNVSFLVDDT